MWITCVRTGMDPDDYEWADTDANYPPDDWTPIGPLCAVSTVAGPDDTFTLECVLHGRWNIAYDRTEFMSVIPQWAEDHAKAHGSKVCIEEFNTHKCIWEHDGRGWDG